MTLGLSFWAVLVQSSRPTNVRTCHSYTDPLQHMHCTVYNSVITFIKLNCVCSLRHLSKACYQCVALLKICLTKMVGELAANGLLIYECRLHTQDQNYRCGLQCLKQRACPNQDPGDPRTASSWSTAFPTGSGMRPTLPLRWDARREQSWYVCQN